MARRAVFILLFIISSGFMPRAVFGYSDQTTHPALTEQAINFYNTKFLDKLSGEEKEWIILGATEEDTPPRWINHFYDPIFKEGWTGENGPAGVSEELLQKFSDVFLSPESAVSALDWIHNQELQEKYALYKGNQTWEKAIYEYVKNNDKKTAYLALGHVLHLLQDMAVPDHTRNDTHTGDSPYENFCSQFNRTNFNIIDALQKENYQPIVLNSLDNYFDYLAEYSNNYFFSKDTINSLKYDKPKIVENDGSYGYGVDRDSSKFKLVRARREITEGSLEVSYFLSDIDEIILRAYSDRLMKEAVLSGAGVLNLFFEEAGKAKNDPSLLKEPIQTKSAIVSLFGEFTRASSILSGAKNWISGLFNSSENLGGGGPALVIKTVEPVFTIGEEESQGLVLGATENIFSSPDPAPILSEATPPPLVLSSAPFSGYGAPLGAGGGYSSLAPSLSIPPEPFPSVVPLKGDEGEPEPEATTTPEEILPPTPPPPPPPPPLLPPADTTPPDISFEIAECIDSFSLSGCLLATTTIHLSWHSSATDLDFFELAINGVSATTTATSSVVLLQDNSVNNFSLWAVDITGNQSELKNISVEISSSPVVINEVAWSGNPNYPEDEWIELFNKTSQDINLDSWVISGQIDNQLYINLSGSIPANGYYLVEKKDDANWALDDSGEILILTYASTIVDQTALNWSNRWPAGDVNGYSMERYSPEAVGSDANSWATNIGLIRNGFNVGGRALNATPNARNSVNYLVNRGRDITADLTLKKADSPYLVNNSVLGIQSGATLTIEPGVTIQFYNDAGVGVYGKILVQGTESDPIIFSSFDNGYWYGVTIFNTAQSGSVFEHNVFKNGGKYYAGLNGHTTNLATEGPAIIVSDSVFEYSNVYGLKLINSDSQIFNNIFRNNNLSSDPAGINAGVYVTGGKPVLQNNIFSGNRRGLYLSGSLGVIEDNVFENNRDGAIYSSGSLSSFTNNSGTGNGINAISLWGDLVASGSSFSLLANPLPYFLSGFPMPTVPISSTLTIEKGVVVKSIETPLVVDGHLVLNGEEPGDIVFTSLYDEPSNTPQPGPGQFPGILISKTGSLDGRGFTMRYAGSTGYGGSSAGGIVIDGGVATISKAVFNKNYPHGLRVINSSNVQIENVRFENHNYAGPWGTKAALEVGNSSVILSGVIFENNLLGVWGDTLSTFITDSIEWINNTTATFPEGLF